MKEPAGTITISGHASQSRKTWPGVRTTCLRSAPARSRASRSSCLRTLTAPHGGGRAGLETLAAAIGEPADTLQAGHRRALPDPAGSHRAHRAGADRQRRRVGALPRSRIDAPDRPADPHRSRSRRLSLLRRPGSGRVPRPGCGQGAHGFLAGRFATQCKFCFTAPCAGRMAGTRGTCRRLPLTVPPETGTDIAVNSSLTSSSTN